jgi:hypothetical protein
MAATDRDVAEAATEVIGEIEPGGPAESVDVAEREA